MALIKNWNVFINKLVNNQAAKIDKAGVEEYWYLSANFDISGNPFSILNTITNLKKLISSDNNN